MLNLMIVLALAICVEGSSRSCAIDKVLVSVPVNSEHNRLAVDIRALSHCHKDDTVAKILETAEVQRSQGKAAIVPLLAKPRTGGGAYEKSCRSGVLRSIITVGEEEGKAASTGTPSSLHGDLDLLLCFCSLAGTFITDVTQVGEFLVEGARRDGMYFNEWDVHQFNDYGTRMCKEFRRRAIAHCMSSTNSLATCVVAFDNIAALVQHNSHKTPRGRLDHTGHFIDTMIAREKGCAATREENSEHDLPHEITIGTTVLLHTVNIMYY